MKCEATSNICIFADDKGNCTAEFAPCGMKKQYSSPKEAADAFRDFLSSHKGEILGVCKDSYSKWGGNAVPLALGTVEKRYKVLHDPKAMPEGEYEKIMSEALK